MPLLAHLVAFLRTYKNELGKNELLYRDLLGILLKYKKEVVKQGKESELLAYNMVINDWVPWSFAVAENIRLLHDMGALDYEEAGEHDLLIKLNGNIDELHRQYSPKTKDEEKDYERFFKKLKETFGEEGVPEKVPQRWAVYKYRFDTFFNTLPEESLEKRFDKVSL